MTGDASCDFVGGFALMPKPPIRESTIGEGDGNGETTGGRPLTYDILALAWFIPIAKRTDLSRGFEEIRVEE
jgi:hypothetical protein